MLDVRTFATTEDGHEVVLEFDNELAFINRIRLLVDGELVDSERVWYGTKELKATLADGHEIELRVHSGMVGEPDRPQLKGADGSWRDLPERN